MKTMSLELKKTKIIDGAKYLNDNYNYIDKFEAIKVLMNMGFGFTMKMALESWHIAFNRK